MKGNATIWGIIALFLIALVLYFTGYLSWAFPGMIAHETMSVSAVSCGSGYVDITTRMNVDSGHVPVNRGFIHGSNSWIYDYNQNCVDIWSRVGKGQSEAILRSIRWGNYDISDWFEPYTESTFQGTMTGVRLLDGKTDNQFISYMQNTYGESFSSSNRKDLVMVFRFEEEYTEPDQSPQVPPTSPSNDAANDALMFILAASILIATAIIGVYYFVAK